MWSFHRLALTFVAIAIIPAFLTAQKYFNPPDGVRVYKSISEALADSSQVEYLDLRRQKLKVIPEQIKLLKNLKYLNLSRNKISEVPAWIVEMKRLEYLDISKNYLKTAGVELSLLPNLRYLILSYNDIGYLPDSLCSMKSLKVLDISGNFITELPEDIGRMATTLEILNLRYLQMTRDEQERIFRKLPSTRIYYTAGCRCSS